MKPINLIILFVCMLTFSVIACKKEVQPSEDKRSQANEFSTSNQSSTQSARFQDNISVSSYGFLIFPSTKDFNDYRAFLITKTHGEVQTYLSSINFTSLGTTLYGSSFLNQRITEEQSTDYLFNVARIFQVQNVIIKPINETTAEVKWEFILTMVSSNLSTSSYQNLANGIFNRTTMNKFATNPSREGNLYNFISNTPFGYEETVANSSLARRPMFGTRSEPVTTCGGSYYNGLGNCVQGCETVTVTTTYIFWIGFSSEGSSPTASWEQPATGC